MSERIDIAMGFDDNYAPHAAAVVASVRRRARNARFRFIMLNTGVAEARRKALESVAPEAEFLWAELREEHLPAFEKGQDLGHVNAATYLRLALETLAPADCRRLIYLDADLIVQRDLCELWAVDLDGAVIGACPDTYCDETAFAEQWALPPRAAGYFNAGVLLIDLAAVRAERLFAKAMDFVRRERPVFADQDALNWVAWGRWAKLDNCWNVQRDMVIPALARSLPDAKRITVTSPGVIHFTGKDKPWLAESWHPWSWLYWDNLARTPFLAEIADRYGVSRMDRLRMRLRWLRRRPKSLGLMRQAFS